MFLYNFLYILIFFIAFTEYSQITHDLQNIRLHLNQKHLAVNIH